MNIKNLWNEVGFGKDVTKLNNQECACVLISSIFKDE